MDITSLLNTNSYEIGSRQGGGGGNDPLTLLDNAVKLTLDKMGKDRDGAGGGLDDKQIKTYLSQFQPVPGLQFNSLA